MGAAGKRLPAASSERERVTLDLVTPHNFDTYKLVAHLILSDPERYGQFGSWTNFAADAPKDDWQTSLFLAMIPGPRAIGFGVINRERGLGDVATLQLGLVPEFRGQGYGPVLGRLLTRYAFEHLGMEKVESTAYASNPASVAMQSGGMRVEGVLRKHCRVRGQYVDQHLFGLTREEWLAQIATPTRKAPQ